MFTKLLFTRARIVTSQDNKKEYLKTMEKLDTAIYGLLKKMDRFLELAYRLSEIIDIPIRSIIGETFSKLRQNMLWLFFEVWPKALEPGDMPSQVAVSALRCRMDVLFSVPLITRFCREFTQNPVYHPPVDDLFQQMFKGLIKRIELVSMEKDEILDSLAWVESALFEIRRAIENLELDNSRLLDEKKEVAQAFVALIRKTGFESLDAVLNLCDMICDVTHDTDREIMVNIRAVLMEKSFSTLREYAVTKVPPKEAVPEITRRLQAFAVHYRPQRAFYRIFFNTYVISQPKPNAPHFSQFYMTNKYFAQAMLMRFSDDRAMKDLLPDAYLQKAKHLLRDLLDQIRSPV